MSAETAAARAAYDVARVAFRVADAACDAELAAFTVLSDATYRGFNAALSVFLAAHDALEIALITEAAAVSTARGALDAARAGEPE